MSAPRTSMPRRKVLTAHRTGGWSSNYFRVSLSCGHTDQIAQGYNGEAPKTSGCFACLKELRAKEKGP